MGSASQEAHVSSPLLASFGGTGHVLQARALVTEETDTEEVISGNGPLSVRVRPSSPKRDCARRTASIGGDDLSNSQADSAGSIPVTRSGTVTPSMKKRLIKGMITIPLAGHQNASRRPRAVMCL